MKYEEKINRLSSLNKFINGQNQDDILLFLDKKYKKYDKWSVICAVKNWFKVVESYLDSSKVLKENTPDYNWGNVYLYICAVDIVVKGIDDLYKIITNDNKHLFDGQNDVFNDIDNDDYHYFQNIRAIFGAHPTDLKENGEYIAATYPTPYDSTVDNLRGEPKEWDYYTLLWSKEKSDVIKQKSFGFSFDSIDMFLDKYILYLEQFYNDILLNIQEYKKEMSDKPINKIANLKKQVNLLKIKDQERLNGRNSYALDTIITLLNISVTDDENKNLYEQFIMEIEEIIPKIHEIIQNPDKYNNIDFINQIIDCDIEIIDNMTLYYYSKLLEYENNEHKSELLIEYFGDKIYPFNNNISSLEELYCLVKARNFLFTNNGKLEN